MNLINEWVTSIVLLILLAVILEMMLPNTALKNYVKLTVSLLLLVMLLQPVLSLFHEDPEEWLYSLVNQIDSGEHSLEEKIKSQKTEIDQFFNAYTSEQVAVQLKDQAEHPLAEKHQTKITDVIIKDAGGGEDLEIEVHIAPLEEQEKGETATEPIEPVSIVIGESQEKSTEAVEGIDGL
ncbi:stage III sporulation protein AF, partial [Bacillus sp. JCM 19041]|uniref:stage III sporulation protein AF n=1 Tax=Bacillus sp. JCM 19041 TaxID=1460637 RepID=UPI0006D09B66